LQKADWTVWQFQWSEWDKVAMASGSFLPAASTAPIYLGTYAENTFPNPIKTATPTITDFTV